MSERAKVPLAQSPPERMRAGDKARSEMGAGRTGGRRADGGAGPGPRDRFGHDIGDLQIHPVSASRIQRSVWDGKDLDKDFWGWGDKGDAISTTVWDVVGLTGVGSLAGGIVEGGKSIYSSAKGNDEAARKYVSNAVLGGAGAIPGFGTLLSLAELDADAGLLGGGPEGDALSNRLYGGKNAEEAPTFSDMFYNDVGKPALDWAFGPSPGTGAKPVDLGDVDDWPESKKPVDLGDVDDWPESKQPVDLGNVDEWPENQGPRDLGDVDEWPENKTPRDLGDVDDWPESKVRDLGDVDTWPENNQPRDLGDIDE